MKSTMKASAGLTFIEIVLVAALILLLSAVTVPLGYRFFQTNQDNAALNQIRGKLRKAQAYSMERRLNTTWGVCLQGRVVRLYAGSCGSPTQTEDYDLPDSVAVSGLNDVSFSALRGEPSVTTTISITSQLSTQSITINAAGGVY